uniref:tetraspanin-4-like n=1 Tax=Scatophagus argus TaxID=75038 RepID=UPI001ED7E80E|nr:tetraspanin-4-like [Scatophagus argus]
MPQVDPRLKCLFITFNIFFTIVGGLIVIVSLAQLTPSLDDFQGGNASEGPTTSHIVLYIGGSVTMVIAILGAYGARRENPAALIVFLVCVLVGGVLMLRAVVLAAVARPKLESLMEERCRSLLPLDQAPVDIKNQAAALQTSLHCCGLFSYEDWEQNIPDSCLCSQQEEMEGRCQTVSYNNFLLNLFWQKKSVFRQNCLPLIMESVIRKANITLGSLVTLLVLVVFGSVLSSLITCQVSSTSIGLPVPVMFDQPPAYEHLYDLSE